MQELSMRLLIGEATSPKAIVITKFLKQNYKDIEVYSYDYRRFSDLVRTKYLDKNFIITSYEDNPKKCLDSISQIVNEYAIDLFIPVDSFIITDIIKSRSAFGNSLNYLGSYESYSVLNNKNELAVIARKLNIEVPEEYNCIETAKIPFVIKPTNLTSSVGVCYVFDELERTQYLEKRRENVVIQEFVSGQGVGYSVYAKDGEVIAGYGHKRLAEDPIAGGSSTYRESYSDSRMNEVATKLMKATKWSGFAMIEFKLTANNKLKLLEVNPRVWGSINQGLANGTNYFAELINEKIPTKLNQHNYKTYMSPLVYRSFMQYFRRFRFKPLLNFCKNILSNRPDVSMIDDINGFLSLVLRAFLK